MRGSLGPAQQARVDELSKQLDAEEAPPVTAKPPATESFLGRVKSDLSIGYRAGVSHLEHTISNVASKVPVKSIQEAGKKSEAAAQRTAPTKQELDSHNSVFDLVAQGAGQVLPSLLENAPAVLLRGKAAGYAPLAAGVVGAVGAMDRGPVEALKEGTEAAAGWYLQGKAGKIKNPVARVAASSVAMAAPAAVATGGDVKKTVAAAVLGGAMGIPAHHEISPEVAQKAMRGGADAVEALKSDIHSTLNPKSLKTLEVTQPPSKEFPTGRKVRVADDRAAVTEETLISRGAERVRRTQVARYALTEARKVTGSLTKEQAYGPDGFAAAIETQHSGSPVPFASPELKGVADVLTSAMDEKASHAEAITQIRPGDPDTGRQFRFYVDYLPRLYKDPKKAQAYMESVGRPVEGWSSNAPPAGTQRRPLGGGNQRSKPRTRETTIDEETGEKISGDLIFRTISDAVKAGIEPAHANVTDMFLGAMAELDRFIMKEQIIKDLAPNRPDLGMSGAGVLQFRDVYQTRPSQGYAHIDDPAFVAYGLTKEGKRQKIGYWDAPTSVARTFNNWLSPGLSGSAAYRTLRSMGNVQNYAQLGLSFFHGGMTAMQSATSNVAIGISKVIEGARSGKGSMAASGLGDIATAPIAPFRDPFRAYDIRRELREPGSTGNPETQKMAERFVQAGGRDGVDPVYITHVTEKLRDAWKEGKTLAAVMRVPWAVLETTAKPLMEHYVPLQKIAAFSKMAEFELQKLGDEATERQKTQAYQTAYRSVENRFGQLSYDNLMWNKIAKDLGMLTIRSVGWKLGTLREIGGGAKDWLSFINEARKSGERAEFTHRMAYTVAMPLVVGTIGAITNYILVGLNDPRAKDDPSIAHPQSWKDYLAPRTGLKDQYGHDERIWFPSYMKDVYHFSADGPAKYAQSSLHPLISTITDMWNNRDFYGAEIYNHEDPLVSQLMDVMGYTAEQFVPLSLRNETREGADDQPAYLKAGVAVGITPAPASIKRSETENYAASLLIQQPGGSSIRKKAESDRRSLNRQIRGAMKSGTDATPFISQGIRDGVISLSDLKADAKQFRFSSLWMDATRLTFANALRVYIKASPEERAEIKPEIARKAAAFAKEESTGKKNAVEVQEIRELWVKIQEIENGR